MTLNYSAVSFLVSSAVILLSGCAASTQARIQAEGETYIRQHIAELSPRSAQAGGTFYVTGVEWVYDDTALVTYEDGHIALAGHTTVSMKDDVVTATRIRLEMNRDDDDASGSASVSSESSSQRSEGSAASAQVSARAGAGIGEFCGGIAGIACAEGTCRYDGTYPDAGGVCVQ